MIGLRTTADRRSTTLRDLLLRLGRALLWLTVAVVLMRGLAGVLESKGTADVPRAARAAAVVWPDEAARAYAVEFAARYLTIDPDAGSTSSAGTAAELAAPEIAAELSPAADGETAPQQVESATVVTAGRLDERRALITVAARVRSEQPRGVRLTVPVARDERGGLVVNDLPSLAPGPSRAGVGPQAGASLFGDDRAAIEEVLTRFLRAYVVGDRSGLAYLVPAGTRVAASPGGFELLDVGSLAALGDTTGRERLVLATVRVRDQASRVTYALRYRIALVRRDRWYVAAINHVEQGRRP